MQFTHKVFLSLAAILPDVELVGRDGADDGGEGGVREHEAQDEGDGAGDEHDQPDRLLAARALHLAGASQCRSDRSEIKLRQRAAKQRAG